MTDGIVEQLVFGTQDGAVIDARVDEFCRSHLGSSVARKLFGATSVGIVRGALLEDGRRVLVKVHQPRESRRTLAEIHRIQALLHRQGFPCPRPLAGPHPVGRGLAVAEELIDRGSYRDTHDPAYRRLMAKTLAWHLELTRIVGRPQALRDGWSLHSSPGLWPPQAHSPIFDFDATAVGAQWIDALATRAKQLVGTPGEVAVGHHDWSGKHFRFAAGQVAVVYDWDSLRLGPEVVIVGNAAMTFTTNPRLPAVGRAPSPDEVRSFVDEYAHARATPLSGREREQIAACATFIAAYTARCEHCRPRGYDAESDPGSFTAALRRHGTSYLQP